MTRNNDEIRNKVRDRYASVARSGSSCCSDGSASCCGDGGELLSIEKLGYSKADLALAPDAGVASLGCGNPTAIASLRSGETVIDLGSGAGFDCFLAAKAVGEGGHVIGVDMTPEMLDRARRNAQEGGWANVEFRLGEIEHLPVADNTADIVISNCVINLVPDKRPVYQEIFRVLKPGGRVAVSDVVRTAEFPAGIGEDMDLLASCISGAITIDEVETIMREAGFVDINVDPKEESREFIREWSPGTPLEEYVVSADIQGRKPA